MFSTRNERLAQISEMVMGGQVTYKIDQIASVYINGRLYFNAFCRYNSPYNIVIEDMNGDFHYHQDYTVRTSLKSILCLNDQDTANIYTSSAMSFKHNSPVFADIIDMHWSDIHSQFHTVTVNFGGIFNELWNDNMNEQEQEQENAPPSTPVQLPNYPILPPPAPVKATLDDVQAAHILLTLSIPPKCLDFVAAESDMPSMSMRFADIQKRRPTCYCVMHSDDEDSYDASDEEEDETNYTILRSGTMIPKAN